MPKRSRASDEAPAPRVPEREERTCRAARSTQRVALLLVEVHDHLGVRRACGTVARASSSAQLAIVVDLAVEDDARPCRPRSPSAGRPPSRSMIERRRKPRPTPARRGSPRRPARGAAGCPSSCATLPDREDGRRRRTRCRRCRTCCSAVRADGDRRLHRGARCARGGQLLARRATQSLIELTPPRPFRQLDVHRRRPGPASSRRRAGPNRFSARARGSAHQVRQVRGGVAPSGARVGRASRGRGSFPCIVRSSTSPTSSRASHPCSPAGTAFVVGRRAEAIRPR